MFSAISSRLFGSANSSSESSTSRTNGSGNSSNYNGVAISRLITYPIKSCAGTSMKESDFTISGLQYDRRWMVIEAESHAMVTARTQPKLFLIEPKVDTEKGQLRIRIPHQGDFSVPLEVNDADEAIDGLQVWGSYDLTGRIVAPLGSPLQVALSEWLGLPVLLVRSTNEVAPRVLGGQKFLNDVFYNTEDALDYPLEDCTTEYADGYPYLIATEQTFVEVERWLEQNTKDIRMDVEELVQRYRPNIVISGNGEAFEEDSWEELRLGDQTFYPVSRCPRCPMPDASPKTGTMSPRRMPGTVVAKFRTGVDKIHKGPCLGMNALSKARSGKLQVGAEVTVVRSVPKPDEPVGQRIGQWVRPEDKW